MWIVNLPGRVESCVYALREEVWRRKKERKKATQCVPAGGSDFAHCHCNFLAGCSFRGVPHHRGITYRWLFVRMSPRVIICLVTRPATAYLAGLFLFRFFLLAANVFSLFPSLFFASLFFSSLWISPFFFETGTKYAWDATLIGYAILFRLL